MENFIVSARKYRPATFDTVVGQLSITTTLKNAIKNNHLAQAFLFCGPRGVGKTTCARILAKTINCFNISANIEACNECESCTTFNNGNSLNIYELDAASNNSVEDIRGLVEKVRIAPQVGKKKIYIIDEVHMLSQSAFNAFLKTLEEPPPYAIFILATTEKHKILPTILSRCQIFDFSRIQVEDIAHHLAFVAEKENIEAEPDALHIIAQKSDGALRDSLSMFDQIVSFAGNKITYKAVIDNLNILDYDYYFKAVDALLEGNISSTLLLFNDILNNGFDGNNFINGLGEHCRNLLVCKDTATISLLEVSNNIKEKYKEQAAKSNVAFLLNSLSIVNHCDVQYKMAKNQRLHVELALLKLCNINNPVKLQAGNEASPKKVEPVVPLQAPAPVAQAPAQTISQATNNTPFVPASPGTSSQAPVSADQPVPSSASPVQPAAGVPRPSPVISKSFSINDILQPKVAASPVPEPGKPPVLSDSISVPTGKQPFDKEKLMEVWRRYALKLQEDGNMNLYSTLTKREPYLSSDYSIEITIDNKVQEDALNADKMIFLGYLRKELNNYDIHLKINLKIEDLPVQLAYTTADKFKRMSEINPQINDLKDRLDLDLDF